MFSITTALVLARLEDAKKEFGPIRSLATLGWMAGALLIGVLAWIARRWRVISARCSGCWWRRSRFFCPRWKFPHPSRTFRGMNASASTR